VQVLPEPLVAPRGLRASARLFRGTRSFHRSRSGIYRDPCARPPHPLSPKMPLFRLPDMTRGPSGRRSARLSAVGGSARMRRRTYPSFLGGTGPKVLPAHDESIAAAGPPQPGSAALRRRGLRAARAGRAASRPLAGPAIRTAAGVAATRADGETPGFGGGPEGRVRKNWKGQGCRRGRNGGHGARRREGLT